MVELGVSEELRAALLKLSASLPDVFRHDEQRVRQRFHFDSTWWRQGGEQVPHLQTIHHAVWQDRNLHIVYRPPYATGIEQVVAPYGLVAKAGIWYLVCARNGRERVHRVSYLLDARLSDESFTYPASFDLAAFWEAWCREHETFLSDYTATVRVAPSFIPHLPRYFGNQIHDRIAQAQPPNDAGWIEIKLSFESFEAARERILGFGRGVEVLEPRALQRSILDYAEQIVDLYCG